MPADPLFGFMNKLPDPKFIEIVLLAQITIVPLSGLLCQMKKAEETSHTIAFCYLPHLALCKCTGPRVCFATDWNLSQISVSQKLGSVFKPAYKKCIITLWVLWLHFKVCLAKVHVSKGKAINGRRHDNSRETISCSSEMRQRCGLPSTCSCLACLRLGLPQVDAAHAKINSFR